MNKRVTIEEETIQSDAESVLGRRLNEGEYWAVWEEIYENLTPVIQEAIHSQISNDSDEC